MKIYSVGTDPPASWVDFPYWIDPEPLARPPSDVAACYIKKKKIVRHCHVLFVAFLDISSVIFHALQVFNFFGF